MFAELTSRREGDEELDVLVYRFENVMRGISSAAAGGGIGERKWALNAHVRADYSRQDLAAHAGELAATIHLEGNGVCLFTAASLRQRENSSCEGIDVEATVGLSHPTWAASESAEEVSSVGTINIVAFVPVTLSDAALVNAVGTATEAKTQALIDESISATGTPSDAVAVFCPIGQVPEEFCGPRSLWGSRLARAVHEAVLAGARNWSA